MAVDLILHLSNRFDRPMDQLATFFSEDPLRVVQAERMIMRLRAQGEGFACHDDREAPYVVYAGLLPYDSPMIHPIRKLCLQGINVYMPVRNGNQPGEQLRYPGLPWWNGGAGRLYPLEKIYYYHTLKGKDDDDDDDDDDDARSLIAPFEMFTI